MPDLASFAAGDEFDGRATIVRAVGEGGFGYVYEATNPRGERVALKLLKFDEGRGYQRSTKVRFAREAQALASMRSPHVVRVLEHGTSATGVLFIIFEWLAGRSLDQVIDAEGTLAPDLVELTLRQLLGALAEAHALDLVHRDIKPDNVVVTSQAPWEVKLLDFGLARPAGKSTGATVTAPGTVIGTPRYMSPEQLMDHPLGPPSDIYSLGLLALESLLGSEALLGNSLPDQLARLEEGFQFDVADANRLGRGLMTIVRRMTMREVSDRYQTCARVLGALDALDSNATGPLGALPSTSKTSVLSSYPVAIGAIACAVACLIAVGLVLTRDRGETEHVRVDAVVASTTNNSPADEPQPQVSPPPHRKRSAGCGKPVSHGIKEITWMSGLQTRRVLGFVPRSYDPQVPSPLIAVFHEGGGETPRDVLTELDLDEVAERMRAVVIAPQGDLSPSYTLSGIGQRAKPWKDADIARATSLVSAVDEAICVDNERVFAIGDGQGAEAALRVSCEAGAAGVIISNYRPLRRRVECRRPLPSLLFAPTGDPRAPVDGRGDGKCSGDQPSLDEYEALVTEQNECEGEGTRLQTVPNAQACKTWTCENEFWSCRTPGGRRWPKSPRVNDECDGPRVEFPRQEVIASFMERVRPPPDAATESATERKATLGCGNPLEPGVQQLTWVSGLSRFRVLASVPASYDPDRPSPLIVAFHEGGGETARMMLAEVDFGEISERERAIVLAPQGAEGVSVKSGGLRGKPWKAAHVEAARKMVASVDDAICLDRSRVLLVGEGSGANAAFQVACATDATAVVLSSDRGVGSCDSPLPTLVFAPIEDPNSPIEGTTTKQGCQGGGQSSLEWFEGALRDRNGCDTTRERIAVSSANGTCHRWACDTPLWSCHIKGGRQWPKSQRPATECDGERVDFPRQEVAWDFLSSVADSGGSPNTRD